MRFERPYIYHSEEVSACGCQNFSPEFLFRMLQGKKKHLKQPLVSAGTRYNRCLLKKRCYLQPLFFQKRQPSFHRSYGNITNHHWVEKNFSCCKLIERKSQEAISQNSEPFGSSITKCRWGGGAQCAPPPGWDRVKVGSSRVRSCLWTMRSSDNPVVSFVKQIFSYSFFDENWHTRSSASYSGQCSGRYALERVSAMKRSSPFL